MSKLIWGLIVFHYLEDQRLSRFGNLLNSITVNGHATTSVKTRRRESCTLYAAAHALTVSAASIFAVAKVSTSHQRRRRIVTPYAR